MMYLLDTNVVSERRNGKTGRAHPVVMAWSDQVDAASTFISVITLRELERGMLLVGRHDPPQEALLRTWIEGTLLPNYRDRILPIDAAIARRCAQLHVPDPRPELDSLIAATALVHGLTVVTRNTADFAPMGVKLLNPWEPQ